jgi:ABC-type nitrate/sulfonate/bicarbonate transport system substrate-binding protein
MNDSEFSASRKRSEMRSSVGLSRRSLIGGAAAGVAAGISGLRSIRADAADRPIRITATTPGSAGSVWRPSIAKLGPQATEGLQLEWIGSNPGQAQVQLAAGALDVSVFGAVGLATLVNRGSDIVLFGPALNNHGRWIVRGDSPYRKPSDLIGKRIATQPETTETYQQARVAASLIGIDLKRDVEVIFGPPTANLALFDRGDVDAVILLEPTATRLIGAGAREIARVGDMWREATGEPGDPFLVGLAAQRSWLESNRVLGSRIARLFAAANGALRRNPQLFVEFHSEIGIKDNEKAAIDLLPSRLADVYPVNWDASVWKVIDRQLDVAIRVGVLDKKPARPIYDAVPLDGV